MNTLIKENEVLLAVRAPLEGLPAELGLHLQITHLRLCEALELIKAFRNVAGEAITLAQEYSGHESESAEELNNQYELADDKLENLLRPISQQ